MVARVNLVAEICAREGPVWMREIIARGALAGICGDEVADASIARIVTR